MSRRSRRRRRQEYRRRVARVEKRLVGSVQCAEGVDRARAGAGGGEGVAEDDERLDMWEGVVLAVVTGLVLLLVGMALCGLVRGCRGGVNATAATGYGGQEVGWLQENWAAGRYGCELELD